jgi:LPXTG-motif cell wall-anchored protein
MPKPAHIAAILLGALLMTLKILFLFRKKNSPHHPDI